MSIFVDEVRNANVMGQTDINKISETVLIPLFIEVYGYRNLRNLNTSENANYPAIDLADDDARVAFQITSKADLEKVKNTLRMFIDHNLHRKYDRLFIYVLTEKQRSYSKDPCIEIVQGKLDFDPARDILDCRNLLKKVGEFQISKTRKIQDILEANFGESKAPLFLIEDEQFTENVHLNLLELSIPSTLYLAEHAIDRNSVPRTTRKYRLGPYRRRTSREMVQDALKQRGLRFWLDWECYQKQIITFHDLSDRHLPLAQIVDQGTVTPLQPEEFYGIDDDHERVFKTLLGRCLQQKLYLQDVHWQNEDKLFIFVGVDEAATRTEQWYGKREVGRVVYERVMKKKLPDQISHYKHFAFRTQYKRFERKWYLLIKPDWFFSVDSYKRSPFSSERVDWLKKQESNSHVFNHLRFIVHFLTHEKPSGLFEERFSYPFLSFGELLNFNAALALDDNDWNPSSAPEKRDSGQLEIFDQ